MIATMQRAEVYRLAAGVYGDAEVVTQRALRPGAFPGLEIDIQQIWAAK